MKGSHSAPGKGAVEVDVWLAMPRRKGPPDAWGPTLDPHDSRVPMFRVRVSNFKSRIWPWAMRVSDLRRPRRIKSSKV